MTLYTLVNEKGKPSIGEHFDTTDRDWICPTVSSIMIGDQNVVLGFDSDDMAKEFANRLNGMKNGGNYDFYFSPRIVSEEAESDYRERFANGELDFGFNKIDSMFKKAKRKKIFRRVRSLLTGALIGISLSILGEEVIDKSYDKLKTSYLATQGTAHVRLYDADGLESIVITNNTSTNPKLTQIPSQGLHNLYSDEFIADFNGLKEGHYEFYAQVEDDLGNTETESYRLNIRNKNEGIESLYGAEAVIDNLRLPSGKERFKLN